jgi:hypothetical protein
LGGLGWLYIASLVVASSSTSSTRAIATTLLLLLLPIAIFLRGRGNDLAYGLSDGSEVVVEEIVRLTGLSKFVFIGGRVVCGLRLGNKGRSCWVYLARLPF